MKFLFEGGQLQLFGPLSLFLLPKLPLLLFERDHFPLRPLSERQLPPPSRVRRRDDASPTAARSFDCRQLRLALLNEKGAGAVQLRSASVCGADERPLPCAITKPLAISVTAVTKSAVSHGVSVQSARICALRKPGPRAWGALCGSAFLGWLIWALAYGRSYEAPKKSPRQRRAAEASSVSPANPT